MAQSADENGGGGVMAQFGLTQSLRADDNRGLATDSRGATYSALTELTFGFASETRTQSLTLDAAVGLRAVDGPGTDGVEAEATDRSVVLAYGRDGASASLDVSGRLVQSDVAFSNTLEDFVLAGQPLPEDFDDLNGTGTRRLLAFDAALSLRDDAPFGLTFRAGLTDLAYDDVTSPDLIDSTRTTLGVDARFDITPVLGATLALTDTRFDEAGADTRRILSLDGAATLARPDGSYALGFGITDTEGGRQVGLSVGRDVVLPTATLGLTLGATRAADGGTFVTAGLDYGIERAAGTLRIGFDRSVRADTDDGSEVQTALRVASDYALGPDSGLGFDLSLARAEATGDGTGTTRADAGITYDYALTRDWSLQADYTITLRDDDADGRATSNSIGLSLSRSFDVRY